MLTLLSTIHTFSLSEKPTSAHSVNNPCMDSISTTCTLHAVSLNNSYVLTISTIHTLHAISLNNPYPTCYLPQKSIRAYYLNNPNVLTHTIIHACSLSQHPIGIHAHSLLNNQHMLTLSPIIYIRCLSTQQSIHSQILNNSYMLTLSTIHTCSLYQQSMYAHSLYNLYAYFS